MRVSATILAFLAAASLTLSPALAAPANQPSKPGKPTSAGRPTNVGKAAGGGKPTTGARPTAAGKPVASTTTHSTSKPTKSAAAKPTTGKPTKSEAGKTTVVASGATTTTGSKSKSKATSTSTFAASSSTGSGSTAPLNPIAQKIASKPNLSAKLTRMLPIDPMTGQAMTLDKASLGFKNQGQFIAALHVSQNLGIPFTELKSHMVTVTPGAPGELPTATQTGSLGRAIQASKATAEASTEVRRAEAQAAVDLQTTTAAPTSRTKTSKKTSGGAP